MTTAPRLSILLAAQPRPGQGTTHADRIRALYAELRAGDLRAAFARLAPGVDWEEDRGGPGLPIRRRHLGRIAVARLLSDPQGLPRALELVHLVESGPEVAVLAAEGPSPEPEGVAPLRIEAHLWTLDDAGLVTRFRQVAGQPLAPTRH
jgi:ketosteroid isomerase-like protein